MSSKATRTIVATIALVSLAGVTAPAQAAPGKAEQRSVWCC